MSPLRCMMVVVVHANFRAYPDFCVGLCLPGLMQLISGILLCNYFAPLSHFSNEFVSQQDLELVDLL